MEHEEVLFFVLGVRHYGALEEDFVARMTPCRAFRKMHQFTLRNLENGARPFDVLKFPNPHTPKGSFILVLYMIKDTHLSHQCQ